VCSQGRENNTTTVAAVERSTEAAHTHTSNGCPFSKPGGLVLMEALLLDPPPAAEIKSRSLF